MWIFTILFDKVHISDRTDRFDEYISLHCDPSRSPQALVASLKSIFGPRTFRILNRVFQKIHSAGVDDHTGRARSTSMTSVRQKRSLDSTLMSLSPDPHLVVRRRLIWHNVRMPVRPPRIRAVPFVLPMNLADEES